MTAAHSDQQPDWNLLLNQVIAAATDRLIGQTTFAPFAASIDHHGQVFHNAKSGGFEYPEDRSRVELLQESIQASLEADEIVIGAVVYDAVLDPPDIPEPSDAIIVNSYDQTRQSYNTAVPYHVESEQLIVGDPILLP